MSTKNNDEWLETLDSWDKDRIFYNPNTGLEDIDDEEYEYLEENDPERLDEISQVTIETTLDMMYPDGRDDD